MIKDIPNKLSRNQLIDAIHEVVPGGITFLYLRHDWEHCCNVGYGFVNFRTLHHLEEFARQRLGQKWALYMSDKELQLSYATIQGHEALVAHFRNSTVMHANPEWRPVVFDTAGEIEHFPPVSIY
ncbi:hypothetical protein FFLO_00301 [Filobasidium floriforme]|uniref:Mei2-like C-terminal RNA recognition motif domain-containing protein n=2 Tax=Filobasidium floriforme TaxID=5210 RepID=A0A8K0JSC6_9TREE|nr:hypothetical protein FFLO_00301 [Filobasidium floriforme]